MSVEEKQKGGRPVSQKTMTKRLNKVKEELKLAQAANLEKIEEIADLTMNSFCVFHDEEKGEYNLVTVAFDLETGLGKVKSVAKIADNYPRMIYEIKKMIANNAFLQEDK